MKITTAGLIGLAAALTLGIAGCNRAQEQGPDPASANMAPAGQTEPVAPAEAPVQSGGYQAELTQAPTPPPPLPEYSQPPCPGDNYMWTPGYWAYSTAGYYWTPGAWVAAPYVGALWTPSWWGYSGGAYMWHAGYWGPYVGFYGGIDYGFGYTGRGFYGGYWQGGAFNYNRTVMNVNTTVVRNVYQRSVVNYTPVNRVSFNGGNGGINLRPTASETVAMRARRMGPAPQQVQYQREAAANRAQFASVNGGRPSVAAARPEPAREAAPPAERRAAESQPIPREVPAMNARPEPRGAPEPRAMQRPSEAPAARVAPEPYRPAPAPGRPAMQSERPPVAARPAMQPNRPAVAARPAMQPNRPVVAARPAMPEQRPSPFQPAAGRPAAPQPHQERSADRRMPEPAQQPAARQAQPQARPEPQRQPEARPAAPQGHPEPQKQDKHSK